MAAFPTAPAAPAPRPVTYPVHLDADTTPHASRWLWLVKWLLAIPHVVVLAFLWVAFAVLSIVAFFAILVTGSYPRALFDFNAGVLRWSWRVAYWSYGALGTDRYPPFTLDEVPDYPAHLEVDYPEHLSRGLVLVKWWLLAIPHYVVVALLVGSGTYAVETADRWRTVGAQTGLIGVLVLVAGVLLAATGRYPQALYDLLLGLNRWVIRVAAYVGLMTDAYPPFRLDQGPHEPLAMGFATPGAPAPTSGSSVAGPATGPGAGWAAAGTGSPTGSTPEGAGGGPGGAYPPAPMGPPPGAGGAPPRRSGWGAGRVVGVVAGSVAVLVSLGLLTGGLALVVADNAARQDGLVTVVDRSVRSAGYAVVTPSAVVDSRSDGTGWAARVVGDVRIRVTPQAAGQSVFVGIGPTADVDRYLGGVARTQVATRSSGDRDLAGAAPSTAPAQAGFWVAQAQGAGTVDLRWRPSSGDWSVVVMNTNASAGVLATVVAGAELPWLGTAGAVLIVVGVLLLVAGAVLVVVMVQRASARHTGPPVQAGAS